LVLVLMVVVAAGCLPSTSRELPPSLAAQFRDSRWTFTPGSPGPEVMPAVQVVAELRAEGGGQATFLRTRAVPVYGLITCAPDLHCNISGTRRGGGERAHDVWLVLYPDTATASGDVAYAWVQDPIAGPFKGGFSTYNPRDPRP
jgi:hypothetical protein